MICMLILRFGIRLLVLTSFLLSQQVFAAGTSWSVDDILIVNENGELLIKGDKSWSRTDFESLGYSLYKDKEIYVSEGVLSNSDDDYDESISYEGKSLLYFEIRNGLVVRGVLVSSKIPVVIKSSHLKFRIGMSLASIAASFKEEDIQSSEGLGIYATFKGLENLSFGSDCSFYPEELTEPQKKMTHSELLTNCKISSIIFLGNEKVVWNSTKNNLKGPESK